MSESTLPVIVIVSLVALPKSTSPVKVPLVPLISAAEYKLPTSTRPLKPPVVAPDNAPVLNVAVPSVNEPPVIRPLAFIVVAPVIAPDIARLLPPVIDVPTSNAEPIKVFFLIKVSLSGHVLSFAEGALYL